MLNTISVAACDGLNGVGIKLHSLRSYVKGIFHPDRLISPLPALYPSLCLYRHPDRSQPGCCDGPLPQRCALRCFHRDILSPMDLQVLLRKRMIHVTAKYYLEDNLDRNERYNVVRVRSSCFMTEHVGIALWFEYMEHSMADNTSFLFGPALIF